MRQLVSKLASGGLSAGVILLWGPLVFPSDTLVSWLIRGVAWTFVFELLVLSLAPLERAVWETAGPRRLSALVEAPARAFASTARAGACGGSPLVRPSRSPCRSR